MPPGQPYETIYALLSEKIDEAVQLAEEARILTDAARVRRKLAHAVTLYESLESFTESVPLTEAERVALSKRLQLLLDSIRTVRV